MGAVIVYAVEFHDYDQGTTDSIWTDRTRAEARLAVVKAGESYGADLWSIAEYGLDDDPADTCGHHQELDQRFTHTNRNGRVVCDSCLGDVEALCAAEESGGIAEEA